MKLFMLVDMDSFFASCEEARRPELRGKPFIVGTNDEEHKLRGVVQTCSYPARRFGIRSAMPTAKAFDLCKDLLYAKPDDEYYEKVSEQLMAMIREYGYPTEVMSIDECALDLGEMEYPESLKKGAEIKFRIRKELSLPSTVGISISKIYAKIVCDDAKPDGLKLVRAEELTSFLQPKGVSKLLGIGPKTESQLNSMGIRTVGDISKANQMVLIERFGSLGRYMYSIARGTDRTGVVETYPVLSIGREATMAGEPTESVIKDVLKRLVSATISDLEKKGMLFKSITAKVRYADFTDKIKTKSMNYYTSSSDVLYSTSLKMILQLAKAKRPRKVGVRVSSLINGTGQHRLFHDTD